MDCVNLMRLISVQAGSLSFANLVVRQSLFSLNNGRDEFAFVYGYTRWFDNNHWIHGVSDKKIVVIGSQQA